MQPYIDLKHIKENDSPSSSPFAIKYQGKYYIKNGHHRVVKDILNGKNSVKMKVFNADKN